MRLFATLSGIAAVMILSLSLGASDAMAGGVRGQDSNVKKRGCRDLVTLKHPDLKGKAVDVERSKCLADPDSYGK